MSHAIYIRDLSETRGSTPRLLAYAIKKREVADRLVHGIVRTYPACGLDPISAAFWFEDANGLHEIWVTPY
jgi:hypothetical protein